MKSSKLVLVWNQTMVCDFPPLSGPPIIQIIAQIQMLGIPSVESQKEVFGVTVTFLRWRSTIYRFCRLLTCKLCLPIMACLFIILTQCWSTDFLRINKIGLAKEFLSISATLLRALLFRFLKYLVSRLLCIVHKNSSCVSVRVLSSHVLTYTKQWSSAPQTRKKPS